jgi:hypothetical protein
MNPQKARDRPEYVAARTVLLDALEALRPHEAAVVLAGAQAVYLRTGPGALPIAEFTTDGDLALDPALLTEAPPLGDLMSAAGFRLAELQGASEPGIWEKEVDIDGVEAPVAVDLIVPAGVAPPGGTRGARLPGHGKRAARKTSGLEAALVDNEVMLIEALDPADDRVARPRVAGVAALLVAKAHKIGDRIETGRLDRLNDKDAADVVRLMQGSSSTAVAGTFGSLMTHPDAGAPSGLGLGLLAEQFGSRAGTGIAMASQALRGVMPEERVRTICLAYMAELQTGQMAPGNGD